MSTVNDRFQNQIGKMSLDGQVIETDIRSSVAANLINDDSKELDRVTKYSLYWKFYKGQHYSQANDAFLSFNYVRAFIDKTNQFLLGDDCFSLKVQGYYSDVVSKEIEQNIEKLLMGVWRKNAHKRLAQELLQMGSVTGDAWMGVFFKEGEGIKITLFDSRKCFPKFKDGNFDDMESFEVRNTLADSIYKLQITVYTKDTVTTWKQKHAGSKGTKQSDKYEQEEFKHNLGKVPVVHFKNKPLSSGYYSDSDAEDILKLNKVYNEIHQELKSIIDYHASPTTIVTGATTKNMSRGLGKVWSGLPPEANVFNLGLDVDLSSTMQFADRLKTAMHELSDIPEGVLGKLQAISGTSAAAIKLTYQPIYQRAALKALTYGEGIKDVNNLILSYYEILKDTEGIITKTELGFLKNIPEDFSNEYECVPIFTYGFPTDRLSVLNEAEIELRLDLSSTTEIMNRLGKRNVPELMQEIREDKLRKAEMEAEVQSSMTPSHGDGGNGGPIEEDVEDLSAEDDIDFT